MIAIFRKELADHLVSKRFLILFILVLAAAIAATYIATQTIRGAVTEDTEFVFLTIFTTRGTELLTFLFFLSLFIPIISIALGFDAINSERNSGNLSRLLSQPIFRDAVINGKLEEVLRLIVFALISIIYGAFWMALAILFSILFKSATTSMLASIGLWIFLFFFMPVIANAITGNAAVQMMVARVSPCTLYGGATSVLLVPELDESTASILYQFVGRLPTPLPFSQSLLLVWPQVVGIIALAAICFAVSYIRFMREEIRAI